jgi:uncharacterized RDD family membrane protein YckC
MENTAFLNNLPPEKYAGFWFRFLAFLIDALILSAISFGLAVAMSPEGETAVCNSGFNPHPYEPRVFLYKLLCALLWWLYFALLESSTVQATPGKLLLGLKTTDLFGNQLNFYRASLRHFCKLLSAITMLVGFLMAAFTLRRQALHDLIAGTLVLRKEPGFIAQPQKQPGSGNLR